MYSASLLRFILGIYNEIDPNFFYIPGLNFVLPTSRDADSGNTDLRQSAIATATLAICGMCLSSKFLPRLFHSTILLATAVMLPLGGGRVSLLILVFTLFVALFLYRKFFLILGLSSILGLGLLFINTNPHSLYELSPGVQRALSSYIFKEGKIKAQEEVKLSDLWHARLFEEGQKYWLKSPQTILIGNGFRPFNEAAFRDKSDGNLLENMVAVAKSSGAFECGLWTVLAMIGLLGGILYINVFIFLLRDAIPKLWKNKIQDYYHAFYFLAVCSIIIWLALCWTSGSFPSIVLMFALFAKTAHDDLDRSKK
jgi:hypothetical protein